uniref:Large ribosomal subunit protein mL43 n=1 Tax=Gallus gallus TaxID=9031 RepID=A0A8V0Z6E3_CHICK
MTGRGTASRFLAAVLHNGVGRYVRQLQRLQVVFSPVAPDARGARQFVEEEAVDFARRHPDVVVYVRPCECPAPVLQAEYLNGTVREELIASKTSEEIVQLAAKLASQSGLDIAALGSRCAAGSSWWPCSTAPGPRSRSAPTSQGPGMPNGVGRIHTSRTVSLLPGWTDRHKPSLPMSTISRAPAPASSLWLPSDLAELLGEGRAVERRGQRLVLLLQQHVAVAVHLAEDAGQGAHPVGELGGQRWRWRWGHGLRQLLGWGHGGCGCFTGDDAQAGISRILFVLLILLAAGFAQAAGRHRLQLGTHSPRLPQHVLPPALLQAGHVEQDGTQHGTQHHQHHDSRHVDHLGVSRSLAGRYGPGGGGGGTRQLGQHGEAVGSQQRAQPPLLTITAVLAAVSWQRVGHQQPVHPNAQPLLPRARHLAAIQQPDSPCQVGALVTGQQHIIPAQHRAVLPWQGACGTDVRRKFITCREVRPWNRLPRGLQVPPSTEVFKARLDGILVILTFQPPMAGIKTG